MPRKTKLKENERKHLPPLLQVCQDQFGTTDLYEVIGVRKQATPQEVKKGYHKTSLAVHPDRTTFEEKEEATRKFQTLGKVYTILSDKNKRAVYDETGDVGEEDNTIEQDKDWCEYWRLLFPKVTVKDIEDFTKKYKGSADELEDLKTSYLEAEGNMDIIMDSVLCSTAEDEARFAQILNDLISRKGLPNFKAFTKESKQKKSARQKRAAAEAAEAEEEARRLKLDDTEDSLKALINKRGKTRDEQADTFFAGLEAKFCQPQKGKKKPQKGKKKQK